MLQTRLIYHRIKYALIFLSFILVFFVPYSCKSNNFKNEYHHYYGVFNGDFYYDNNSLLSNENVKTTIEANKLDFWIFGLHEKNKKELFSLINKISSKNQKNKEYIFANLPVVNKYFYPNNPAEIVSIFFNDGNSQKQKNKIYPIYRDLEAKILFDTINVNYKDEITNNTNRYFNLLDNGYILGAISSCEIIGPEWKLNSPVRTVILSEKKKQKYFIEALRNRKTYITTNPHTKIIFKINKNIIGDVIKNQEQSLKFFIKVQNPAIKIRKIKIITNNNLTIFSQDSIYKSEYSLTKNYNNKNSFSYYYLKVDLQNGDTAFTTPIWVVQDKKFLINDISASFITKKIVKIKYNISNISSNPIHNIKLKIGTKQKLLGTIKTDLKNRETKEFSLDYPLSDSTNDEIIYFNGVTDTYTINSFFKINKNITNKKIAFDTGHFNIFSNMFSKIIKELNDRGYIATTVNKEDFKHDYPYLNQYDLLIMTAPEKVYQLFDKNLKILYDLQKYVYNGGSVIIAGFNSKKAQTTTVFLNEILRLLYSPIKFRIKNSNELYPIFDEKTNYDGDIFVPVFNISQRIKLKEFATISKIYVRDPVEIYGVVGGNEVPFKNIYRVTPLIYYNDSTCVKKRKIRNHKNHLVGGLYKFGKGKVCVLSGINFSDYDIDILENKEWFIGLVDYILRE